MDSRIIGEDIDNSSFPHIRQGLRIIPSKGPYLEFCTNAGGDVMQANINGKRIPVSVFVRAMGYSTDRELLDLFGLCEEVSVDKDNPNTVIGRRVAMPLLRECLEETVDEDTGDLIKVDRYEVFLEREETIDSKKFNDILNYGYKTVLLLNEPAYDEYSPFFTLFLKILQHLR